MQMDQQPKTPTRPSGIPRPVSKISRLPLPTTTSSKSIKPSPSREKIQADTGLDAARLRRPSEEGIFKKPAIPRPASLKITPDGPDAHSVDDHSPLSSNGPEYDTESRGRDGASLSERTMKTLSQLPPSAGPSRRQSNFFSATSPVRSPSRPTSSMTSYSRSPSRSSSTRQQSGSELLFSQPATTHLPSRLRMPAPPSLSTNGSSTDQESTPALGSSPKIKPSARTSLYDMPKSAGSAVQKPRRPMSKQSTKPAEPGTEPLSQNLHVKKTRKMPSNSSLSVRSPSSTGSRKSSIASTTQDLTQEQQSEVETRKHTNSSNALRESIAKAKAARKAAAQSNKQTAPADPFDVSGPFNQQPKDSNLRLLRKRVESGRTTGHLSIAAMSLTQIPNEVMTMYDFDPDSSTDWYEAVDLVKFIAADNELAELPDSAFPDVDPQDIDLDANEKGNQFGGLEVLDLHGNLLQSLPTGFRRLHRLHSLNLSNNRLGLDDLRVVWEMEWLCDLKLARNQLQGAFPSDISRLRNLEVLDLHENSLTELPEDLEELGALRMLDVGYNQLGSLPFEALSKLPLREICAPKNKLTGTLIPASVQQFEALQNLDVVSNQLEKLSDNEQIEFPNLQVLNISVNRVKTLPNISTWRVLVTLFAEENSISEIPPGFVESKSVRNVDFTGNDISRLDERIGLMENLVILRVANNPLRDRKFLSMATDDIKRYLRTRCEPPEIHQDTDDEGSVATQFTLAPEAPEALDAPEVPESPETPAPPPVTTFWKVKPGGVLDRSYTDVQELDACQLEATIAKSQDIRSLHLQHNAIPHFPVAALSLLSGSLIDLDLSHNPLNSAALFSSSLSLPSLQNLSLSATGLTTLEPLLANLSASHLTFLDISSNRLTGSLPHIRRKYPGMKTLNAADNQLEELEFEAVRGLQVLDVGNNNINSLPSKIGLLRAEGSSKNWGCGSALRRFEITGNTFRVPRWQTVAKGTDAILDWLKDRIPTEELHELESDDKGGY